jgi:hypothetical protein
MTEDLEEFSPQRLFCYNITTKSEGKHITLPWPGMCIKNLERFPERICENDFQEGHQKRRSLRRS